MLFVLMCLRFVHLIVKKQLYLPFDLSPNIWELLTKTRKKIILLIGKFVLAKFSWFFSVQSSNHSDFWNVAHITATRYFPFLEPALKLSYPEIRVIGKCLNFLVFQCPCFWNRNRAYLRGTPEVFIVLVFIFLPGDSIEDSCMLWPKHVIWLEVVTLPGDCLGVSFCRFLA